jgi:predicted transcriptional regulator
MEKPNSNEVNIGAAIDVSLQATDIDIGSLARDGLTATDK